ncbi:hypothetical protein [Streptomyces decoyicus]|uniref:hypothetical protein n=1 Tax=Streptomyces decoyicus TaxID=249567 RepID=UPI0004AACCAC|nr:hypothetical protein [Streptomyces decoyicus]KOG50574.1 hypothetical protein ADK74_00565 [Streptomyces decoyicus]QZY15162.1 hypothetical protein K7C20_07785 [Streptomyces decoyicus]
MADIYEVSVAMDLRDDLSEAEIAELQWHLGLGPEPERLSIVPEFPIVVENGLGELVTKDAPAPLLGCHGEAWKVGGALTSVLVRREQGWALTARQEIHPDDYDRLGELLNWLATKASDQHRPFDGSVHIGWIRFYEADRPDPLRVRDGRTVWP